MIASDVMLSHQIFLVSRIYKPGGIDHTAGLGAIIFSRATRTSRGEKRPYAVEKKSLSMDRQISPQDPPHGTILYILSVASYS